MMTIGKILRPTSELFQSDEMGNRCDANDGVRELDGLGATPEIFKVDGMFGEQVDLQHRVGRIVE